MGTDTEQQILPLAQDEWLLDSYLNATGHIRYGPIYSQMYRTTAC